MSRKKKIEPNIVLTIDIHGYFNIAMVVSQNEEILAINHIEKLSQNNYNIRKRVIELMMLLYKQYAFDTIIFEQNQLFIDKIDRHPDPLVYRNILLGFSIANSIEDNFYEIVPYILAIPEIEWRKYILNRTTTYSIDLYKSHILSQGKFSEEELKTIEMNNYYKVLCLSESIGFDKLIDRRYQINEGN